MSDFIPEGAIELFEDGIGYARLVDSMGDSFTPAEDARMSTGKGRLGPEKDLALMKRLLKDGHTSPFEGVVVKLEFGIPLNVRAELDRHRTVSKEAEWDPFDSSPEEGMRRWFARNEMSGRYVQMPDLYYVPKEVRGQSATNMQGGSENAPSVSQETAEEFKRRGVQVAKDARELYVWACSAGIEKGMARFFNTQNQYTFIRYTASLKNWFDMLYLRLPNHVLWECRMVAVATQELLRRKFPEAVDQWRELVYDGVRLTRSERKICKKLLEFYNSKPFYTDGHRIEDDVSDDRETVLQLLQLDKKLGA